MSVWDILTFDPKLPEFYLEVFRKVSDNFLAQKVLRKGKYQYGTKFAFFSLLFINFFASKYKYF